MLELAISGILDVLTPGDVRILIACVDEMNRAGEYECLFPQSNNALAARYLRLFEKPRYHNFLCVAFLINYSTAREEGLDRLRSLAAQGIHTLWEGDSIPQEHTWKSPAQLVQRHHSLC
ncbi:Tubulin polyglutamylase ttll4 [Cichlidogyrus casuarinus]|uniref:Tubulin polyglutamylase ttll4 n=1 Tax=Cichlidogyrus casuarinus TaxID=1844966 RepID=A0ABD2QEC0_9PLAT